MDLRNSIEEKRESKRVKELEDIICTLKFELNGLKNVVATVESDAVMEREMIKKGFQQRVQHVVDWLNQVQGEVEKKAAQLSFLEEKVSKYKLYWGNAFVILILFRR